MLSMADEKKDWSKHNFELEPITKDMLDMLPAFERSRAVEGYQEWLKRQRETDLEYEIRTMDQIKKMKRRIQRRKDMRIFREKHPTYYHIQSIKKRSMSRKRQKEKEGGKDK